jgi:hypothetical protein
MADNMLLEALNEGVLNLAGTEKNEGDDLECVEKEDFAFRLS